MRVIIAPEFYQQMLQTEHHPVDCYVRPGEYLHHLYIDGVKYVVAPAVLDQLEVATSRGDLEAVAHLTLHKLQYEMLLADAERYGSLDGVTLLGDPPPSDDDAPPPTGNSFLPRSRLLVTPSNNANPRTADDFTKSLFSSPSQPAWPWFCWRRQSVRLPG